MAGPTSEVPKSTGSLGEVVTATPTPEPPPVTPTPTPTQEASEITPTPEVVPIARPFGMAAPPEPQAPVVAPSGIKGILARIPILGRVFR